MTRFFGRIGIIFCHTYQFSDIMQQKGYATYGEMGRGGASDHWRVIATELRKEPISPNMVCESLQ